MRSNPVDSFKLRHWKKNFELKPESSARKMQKFSSNLFDFKICVASVKEREKLVFVDFR